MKKIDWIKIVDVKDAVIVEESLLFGCKNFSAKLLGKKYFYGYERYIDGEIFRSNDEIKLIVKHIKSDSKKEIPFLFSRIYKITKDYMDFCREKSKTNFEELSNEELAKIFDEFFIELAKICVTLNTPLDIDCAVTELIEQRLENHPKLKGKPEKIISAFNALTISTDESDVILEKKALLELANELTKGKEVSLEEVYKRFTFTYYVFMKGKFKSIEEYEEEVKELSKNNPEEELKKIINHRKNELGKLDSTIKELDIRDDFLEIVNFAREAVYIRTYRLDRINEGVFIIYPLLKEIAKRLNLSEKLVPEILIKEITDALRGKIKLNKDEIKERLNGYGCEYITGEKSEFYFGKDFEDFKKKNETKVKLGEIKGRPAFPGIVIGKVVVVRSKEELNKVKKGDILVTKMTTPDYIKEMEKSAAVVTEIGGITTHAAIVSRELGKPCVMGTGNATHVLKDGDIVEVDANKGVVKKIK